MTVIRALISMIFTLALCTTGLILTITDGGLPQLGGVALLAASGAMVLYTLAVLNDRFDFTGARAPLR